VKDHYETLGVTRTAPPEVVKAAWKALAQMYHPDRNKDPGAVEEFKRAQGAYEVLADPAARAAYDRELQSGAGGTADTGHAAEGGSGRERTDTWAHEGLQYVLHYRDGVVAEHREWVDYKSVLKRDDRLFIGRGAYTGIEGTPKQHICLRLGDRDEFVEREGAPIPIASSQPVTLVSLEVGGHTPAIPIVLINHATQQWHSLRDFFSTLDKVLPREWGSRRISRGLNAQAVALLMFVTATLLLARHLPWILSAIGSLLLVLLFGGIVRAARTRAAVRVLRTRLSAAGINNFS
jgi:hypothetical protein